MYIYKHAIDRQKAEARRFATKMSAGLIAAGLSIMLIFLAAKLVMG